MDDRPTEKIAEPLPADERTRATAVALAARVLERAKAPGVAPFPRPQQPGDQSAGLPHLRPDDPRADGARHPGDSPNALAQTVTDWMLHLAQAPGKRTELAQTAAMTAARLAVWYPFAIADGRHAAPFAPASTDRRFSDPGWSQWPFNAFVQNFLGAEAWWAEATRDVPGLARDREAEVAFMARAAVDMVSPSNIPWLNPVSIAKTVKEGGHEPRPRRGELDGRLRPHARRPAAGRGREVRGRTRRRGHARQGRVPQRPDGADPVRAGDADGVGRADPDHPGLDHEILHPRPRAEELAGPLAGRARAHRVHGVVEEPGRARPRRRPRRLPPPRRQGRARRGLGNRSRARRSTPAATASAAPSSPSPPRRWRATATTGSRA